MKYWQNHASYTCNSTIITGILTVKYSGMLTMTSSDNRKTLIKLYPWLSTAFLSQDHAGFKDTLQLVNLFRFSKWTEANTSTSTRFNQQYNNKQI